MNALPLWKAAVALSFMPLAAAASPSATVSSAVSAAVSSASFTVFSVISSAALTAASFSVSDIYLPPERIYVYILN